MSLIIKDRVKETTTTTGTGTVTLAGASSGFRSFADIGNGNTTYYTIVGGSEWEVGLGTYTASGTTLSRDTVLSNSLGTTAKINFSAGSKDVFCTYPSGKALLGDTSAVASTGTGSVVLSNSPTLTGTPNIADASASSLQVSGVTQILGSLQLTGTLDQNQQFATNQTIGSLDIGGITSGTVSGNTTFVAGQSSGTIILGGVNATGAITLGRSTSTQSINIGGSGNVINIGGTTGTGTITLGRSTGSQSIGIGNSSAGGTITIGNAIARSGAIQIGSGSQNTSSITIGSSTFSNTVNIASGSLLSGNTKALNLGTNGATGSTTNIAIGSATGTSTTTLNGAVALSATTQAIDIGNSQTTSAITVGGTSGTGTITLGQSTESQTINIGTGNNTGTKFINIGSASSTGSNLITIGKLYGSGTYNTKLLGNDVTVQSSNNLNLTAPTMFLNTSYIYMPNSFGQQATYVADFPTAFPTPQQGDRIFVADANNPRTGDVVTGGGLSIAPAYFDGLNWIYDSGLGGTTGAGSVVLNSSPAIFNPSIINGATIQTTTQAIDIGTTQSTGAVTIGGTGATGAITLGQSTGAQNINISNGEASTSIVNIGGTGLSTGNINIGRSVGNQTISIGSGATGSTVNAGNTRTINIGTTSFSTGISNVNIGKYSTSVNHGTFIYGNTLQFLGNTFSTTAQTTIDFSAGTTLAFQGTSGVNIQTGSGGSTTVGAASDAQSLTINHDTTTINSPTVTVASLIASQAVFTDASKKLVSKATTGSGSVVLSNSSAPSGAIVGISDTQTLINKRITSRVSTITSGATPTINTDNTDQFGLTAQAVDITSFTTNLSGTPTDGQKLWIYIVGTAARAITWGASFEASTVALPTTTVTTNRLDVGFVWNAATSKWRCVAVA